MMKLLQENQLNITPFETVNEQDINNLEKKIGILLPEDYKNFLLTYNGGIFNQEENSQILIKELKEIIYLDVMYGIDTGERCADIDFWMEEFNADLLPEALVIGDDLRLGLIVLICNGENSGVYYWDDSYNFEASNDENNMYFLANSFSEFCQLVKKDDE